MGTRDRQTGRQTEAERETDSQRQKGRQTDRGREAERQRDAQTDRQTDIQREEGAPVLDDVDRVVRRLAGGGARERVVALGVVPAARPPL
jgi:hypothetical protein